MRRLPIMSVWQETNWFAVQAKPSREALAAAVVSRMDLDVFFPKVRLEHSVCGISRLVIKPLFPGYFFAKFCPNVSLDGVRHSLGVLRVVGTPRIPLPVAGEIISSIHQRVQPDGYVELKPNRLRPGHQVAIERGPLAGWMGRVERESDDGRRVMILVEALEQARIEVEKSLLRQSSNAV